MNKTDEELVSALRASLNKQAGQVQLPAEPFDLRRPGLVTEVGAEQRTDRVRHGRGAPVVLAAAAVIVLLGVAVALTQRDSDSPSQPVLAVSDPLSRTPQAPTTSSPADPASSQQPVPPTVELPTAIPDGLTLWSLKFSEYQYTAARSELFVRGGGGKVLVTISLPGFGGVTEGPLVVRGQPAKVQLTKNHPDVVTTLSWSEGVTLTAQYRGMGQAEAISVLDSLVARSDDAQSGFDVAETDDVQLFGEAVPNSTPTFGVSLVYRSGPGTAEAREITVGGSPAQGGPSADYLGQLLVGEAEGDGSVVTYDPKYGTYDSSWPDGRSVGVSAGSPFRESELRTIAESARPTTGAELLDLRRQLDTRLSALPLVGEAELPSGTVRVMQAMDDSPAICLYVADFPVRCSSPYDEFPNPGSFLIDGTWYAVSLSGGGEVDFRVGSDRNAPVLDAQTGQAGPFKVSLVEAPPDARQITVGTSTSRSGFPRPLY